jgi:hypothetical protein
MTLRGAVGPALLFMLAACGSSGPKLQRFDQDTSAWVDQTPLSVDSLSIDRAGDEVHSSVVLTGNETQIALSMELYLEPPARFVRGSHESTIEGTEFAGPLTSESVEFFGGQNEGASVGGTFVLARPDGTRYRVRFPATPAR